MAKTAGNGHSVVSDSEFTSEARQLLHQALDKSELYPTNFEHYIGRPRLLEDIRRHFDRTKRKSLVFVEGLTGFRQTFFLQKQVRTVWYDLDVGLDAQAQEIRLVRDLHNALGINGSDFKPGPDPIYRFIILESSAPASPRLKITEQMLLKILTYHYVSPYFLDLVSHICYEPGITGVPFSSFRCLTTFSQSSTTNRFPDPALGRSGLNYQLVLELRTVFDPKILEKSDGSVFTETTSGNDEPELWPITQYAVYHQFDISTGKCLWIMTSASHDALAQIRGPEDIKAALGIKGQAVPLTTMPTTVDCFRSSLSVWTWLGDWSLSDYDNYITTLDERLQELELDHINKKSERPIDEITLKTINTYMEALDKCIVALKSNLRVFQSLLQLYGKDLVKEPYLETCSFMQAESGTRTVVLQHIEKFKVELKLICDTTEEMIGRAYILKEIGTRRENTTHRVLQNRDTATMKELAKLTYIFSTITLLLLPISVVSTIFSTDIVRFQIPEGDMGGYGGNWSAPAAVWWAAATIIVTSLVGWVGESWRRKSVMAAKSSKAVNKAPATTIAFDNFPRIALAKLRRTFHDTVDQSRLWVRRYEVIHNRVATKFRKKDNDNPDMGRRDQNVYYDMQSSSGMGSSKAEPRTPTIPQSAGGMGVIEKSVRHGDEITEVSRGAGEVASGSGSFDKGSLMEQGAVVGVAKVALDEGK